MLLLVINLASLVQKCDTHGSTLHCHDGNAQDYDAGLPQSEAALSAVVHSHPLHDPIISATCIANYPPK